LVKKDTVLLCVNHLLFLVCGQSALLRCGLSQTIPLLPWNKDPPLTSTQPFWVAKSRAVLEPLKVISRRLVSLDIPRFVTIGWPPIARPLLSKPAFQLPTPKMDSDSNRMEAGHFIRFNLRQLNREHIQLIIQHETISAGEKPLAVGEETFGLIFVDKNYTFYREVPISPRRRDAYHITSRKVNPQKALVQPVATSLGDKARIWWVLIPGSDGVREVYVNVRGYERCKPVKVRVAQNAVDGGHAAITGGTKEESLASWTYEFPAGFVVEQASESEMDRLAD
jgi:hypothetical protein